MKTRTRYAWVPYLIFALLVSAYAWAASVTPATDETTVSAQSPELGYPSEKMLPSQLPATTTNYPSGTSAVARGGDTVNIVSTDIGIATPAPSIVPLTSPAGDLNVFVTSYMVCAGNIVCSVRTGIGTDTGTATVTSLSTTSNGTASGTSAPVGVTYAGAGSQFQKRTGTGTNTATGTVASINSTDTATLVATYPSTVTDTSMKLRKTTLQNGFVTGSAVVASTDICSNTPNGIPCLDSTGKVDPSVIPSVTTTGSGTGTGTNNYLVKWTTFTQTGTQTSTATSTTTYTVTVTNTVAALGNSEVQDVGSGICVGCTSAVGRLDVGSTKAWSLSDSGYMTSPQKVCGHAFAGADISCSAADVGAVGTNTVNGTNVTVDVSSGSITATHAIVPTTHVFNLPHSTKTVTGTTTITQTDVATATPAANEIPIAGSAGQLAPGFIASGTPTTGQVPAIAGGVPAWHTLTPSDIGSLSNTTYRHVVTVANGLTQPLSSFNTTSASYGAITVLAAAQFTNAGTVGNKQYLFQTSYNALSDSLWHRVVPLETGYDFGGGNSKFDLYVKSTDGITYSIGAGVAGASYLVSVVFTDLTWGLATRTDISGLSAVTTTNAGDWYSRSLLTTKQLAVGTLSTTFAADIQAASAVMALTSTTGANGAYIKINNTGGDIWIGRNDSSGTLLLTSGGAAYDTVINSRGGYPIKFAVSDGVYASVSTSGISASNISATPTANFIPKAGAGHLLDPGWLPAASTSAQGAVQLYSSVPPADAYTGAAGASLLCSPGNHQHPAGYSKGVYVNAGAATVDTTAAATPTGSGQIWCTTAAGTSAFLAAPTTAGQTLRASGAGAWAVGNLSASDVTGVITGAGTANKVAVYSGASTLIPSTQITDNGTNITISAVTGNVALSSTTATNGSYYSASNSGGALWIGMNDSTGGFLLGSGGAAYDAVFNSHGGHPIKFGISDVVYASITTAGIFANNIGTAGAINTIAKTDSTHTTLAASFIPDLSGTYVPLAQKAAASGVATLDGSTKVPIAQLPTGTTSTTVAAGNDSRIVNAVQNNGVSCSGANTINASNGQITSCSVTSYLAANAATGTGSKITFSGGQATSIGNIGSSDVTSALGYTPLGGSGTSGYVPQYTAASTLAALAPSSTTPTVGVIPITNAANLNNWVTHASGDVPTSTTVCGHALSSNVTCTAADVGALSGSGSTGGLAYFTGSSTLASTVGLTATPSANVVPVSNGSGNLNSWVGGRLVEILNGINNGGSITTSTSGAWITAAMVVTNGTAGSIVANGSVSLSGTGTGTNCLARITYDGSRIGPEYVLATLPGGSNFVSLAPQASYGSLTAASHTLVMEIASTSGNSCNADINRAFLQVAHFSP